MWMELKQGQKNPMLEAALAISLTGEMSPEEAERERELDAMRGEKVADDYRDDPRLKKEQMVLADPVKGVEASNPSGSFEALMGGWGRHPTHGQALDTGMVKE
jgi:hypothetical protein